MTWTAEFNSNRVWIWFQHLFALRSKHKGQDRTYYLAADSERDMTKWVECLCNVCGCKPVPDQNEGKYQVVILGNKRYCYYL